MPKDAVLLIPEPEHEGQQPAYGIKPGYFNPKGIESFSPALSRQVFVQKFINPERVASIPHIPFIKFNIVAFQEFPELILKRNLAMMFLLPGDVFPNRLDL